MSASAARGTSGRRRWLVTMLAAAAVVVASLVALAIGAAHGVRDTDGANGRSETQVARANDAFYQCVSIQAHHLVSTSRPVVVTPANIANYVLLLQAVGGWATLAPVDSRAAVHLSLEPSTAGQTCRGLVVVASRRMADGTTRTRRGWGATASGSGPPPAVPALSFGVLHPVGASLR